MLLSNPVIAFQNRDAKVYQPADALDTLVCELLVPFIPEQKFHELFEEIGAHIRQSPTLIRKFIFDKRKMTTFHQASMVWYHTVWKPQMYELGVMMHRKILPKDTFFRKSVEIGRDKIAREHPDFDWEKYNIVYCESLEEAFEK